MSDQPPPDPTIQGLLDAIATMTPEERATILRLLTEAAATEASEAEERRQRRANRRRGK